MKGKTLYVRPSHALCFDECGFAYYLKYVLGVKPNVTPANLPFGTAMHGSCTGFILAEATGDTSFDPVEFFRDAWQESLDTEPMDFSGTWGPKDLEQTGLRLVDLFPKAWRQTGYAPLIDADGPVVERRFYAQISDDVILTGQPDVVAMDTEGDVIPLDIKSSAQAYDETFLLASEQLTDYQILVEDNGRDLGLGEDGISKVGFFEGIKRKIPKTGKGQGPEFLQPLVAPARSEEVKLARKQKLIWMAEDVRRGRFSKRPRMAYNTPCTLCEFSDYCLKGNKSDLIFPDDPQQTIALQTAAPLI